MNDKYNTSSKKDRTKNIKTLLRLFPYMKDKTEAANLKIDADSLHYISVREAADNISAITAYHLKELNIDPTCAVVTDATAGVGGNSISFGNNFAKTYAIEIDRQRAEYLMNNIHVYKLGNVSIINDDCIKVLPNIHDHNVVFIDPPWGGKYYKDYIKLRLKIGDMSVEQLCNSVLDKDNMTKTPDIIVVKLPVNYDIRHFYYTVNHSKIYFYDLKKMYIMVVIK